MTAYPTTSEGTWMVRGLVEPSHSYGSSAAPANRVMKPWLNGAVPVPRRVACELAHELPPPPPPAEENPKPGE
jgi:hypothetical protein